MANSLKYDPLHTFLLNDRRNKDIDNLIFLKIEDNLQVKINDLMKKLITEEDVNEIEKIKAMLQNTIQDKEDAQRNLEINIKKANEVPIINSWTKSGDSNV